MEQTARKRKRTGLERLTAKEEQMEHSSYADFRLEAVQHITQYLHAAGGDQRVQFFGDGYIADSEESKQFIRETNIKYGHPDANTLVGDFILVLPADQKGLKYTCRFEVKWLYETYIREGWGKVEQIVDYHLREVKKVNPTVLSSLNDYSKIKDRLILCLRNTEKSVVRYRDSVFQKFGDMAMVLYFIAGEDKNGNRLVASVPRTSTVSWNMKDDDILAAALLNTARLSPPRIYMTYEDTISGDPDRGDFMNPLKPLIRITEQSIWTTVTAIPNTDGAIAMFYPGVMERISAMAGGDYFVVFTAKDEAHIHLPGTASVQRMKASLRDVNKQFPQDMLTNSVFYYDSKRKQLKKV